ncbi:MAG TPA: SWIM zinc finger family protein [Rubrobacteraceae bacterium]|nr:SWIM zinc finger family protein [Rubrobacteraceae bacterium]
MDRRSVAQHAHETPTREERWRAIQERTTRGLLTFNAGGVAHLEADQWAVRSTRGGFHRVDLVEERCSCPDFEFFGREHGIPCRHVYAVAIAHATRRRRRSSCPACFGGYVTITVEEDGQEHDEAVPCRRCNGEEE